MGATNDCSWVALEGDASVGFPLSAPETEDWLWFPDSVCDEAATSKKLTATDSTFLALFIIIVEAPGHKRMFYTRPVCAPSSPTRSGRRRAIAHALCIRGCSAAVNPPNRRTVSACCSDRTMVLGCRGPEDPASFVCANTAKARAKPSTITTQPLFVDNSF